MFLKFLRGHKNVTNGNICIVFAHVVRQGPVHYCPRFVSENGVKSEIRKLAPEPPGTRSETARQIERSAQTCGTCRVSVPVGVSVLNLFVFLRIYEQKRTK